MSKHILVTNDDGVLAPGLLALTQEMRKLGKVTVLAPDRNWSGAGHVKTLDRALRVREVRLADGTKHSPAMAPRPIVLHLPRSVMSKSQSTWWYPASMPVQTLGMMSPIPGR